jgi:hypothetical protein
MRPTVVVRRLCQALSIVLGVTNVELYAGEVADGSVCILPYPTGDAVRGKAFDGRPLPKTYSVRFDQGRMIALSSKQATLVTGFKKGVSHLVAIRGDGRPYAAFRFRFEALMSERLCLSQSNYYQTWQLDPADRMWRSCQCTGAVTSSVE